MNTVKLYDGGTATGNAVAQVVIPSKSRIRGIQWAVRYTSITAGAVVTLEVSKASATEIGTNGAQQCISEVQYANNFVTSGMTDGNNNLYAPCDISVTQGQIIYLHVVVTGTCTYEATALIWFE